MNLPDTLTQASSCGQPLKSIHLLRALPRVDRGDLQGDGAAVDAGLPSRAIVFPLSLCIAKESFQNETYLNFRSRKFRGGCRNDALSRSFFPGATREGEGT
jgi:hypothetical protein